MLHGVHGRLTDRATVLVDNDEAVSGAHCHDAEGVAGGTRVGVEVVVVASVQRRALERQTLAVAHADRLQELWLAAKQVVVRADAAHGVHEPGDDVLLNIGP